MEPARTARRGLLRPQPTEPDTATDMILILLPTPACAPAHSPHPVPAPDVQPAAPTSPTPPPPPAQPPGPAAGPPAAEPGSPPEPPRRLQPLAALVWIAVVLFFCLAFIDHWLAVLAIAAAASLLANAAFGAPRNPQPGRRR